MLRDNLVELIEPMLNSAGADPLALYIHTRTPASDDSLPCLKNPRPEGAESSLTESASSPFQAEPAQCRKRDHLTKMNQNDDALNVEISQMLIELETQFAEKTKEVFSHYLHVSLPKAAERSA